MRPRRVAAVPVTVATVVTGLVAALAPATAVPSAAAQERAMSYVALGDSYASGLGTREYLDDGTECRRSPRAYPSLIAAAAGHDLDLRACSGARIPDVTSAQLGALDAGTGLVSVSVGGNDAGFADVLTECALPAWASDCDAAVDDAQAYVAGPLPGALGTLYGRIRGAAVNARVVVVGYPRVFMGEDCDAATFFSPHEQTRLNQTADQLNARLRTAATEAGFGFADPTTAFTGHAVCDDPEWLNGFSNPVAESYHPNVAGHRDGYTPLVSARTGTAVRATPGVLAEARRQAPAQAALQRTRAGADAGIEPEVFATPDLTTPRVRAAARRAGVDLLNAESVASADRRYSREQARDRAPLG